MSQETNGIFVANDSRGTYVRIQGRGTCQNAQVLREAGQQAISQGSRMICVDLGRCQGMDSTFLGVLAGFGLRLQEINHANSLHLLNAGERSFQSCQCLGLGRVAHLESGQPADPNLQPPPVEEFRKLPGSDLAVVKHLEHIDTTMLMLEAHNDLCRTDEGNEAKFKEVKECLREELQRHSDKNGS